MTAEVVDSAGGWVECPTGSMSDARPGISFVEVMAVMAALAILASLGLSTVAVVRESALSARCKANLQQMGCALGAYQIDWRDRWPAPVDRDSGLHWNATIWNQLGLGSYTEVLAASPLTIQQGPTSCPGLPSFNAAQAQMRGYGMTLSLPPCYSRTPSDPGAFEHPIPSRMHRPALVPVLADSRGRYRPDCGDWQLGSLDAFAIANLIGYVHRKQANVLFGDLHVGDAGPDGAAASVQAAMTPAQGPLGPGSSF